MAEFRSAIVGGLEAHFIRFAYSGNVVIYIPSLNETFCIRTSVKTERLREKDREWAERDKGEQAQWFLKYYDEMTAICKLLGWL